MNKSIDNYIEKYLKNFKPYKDGIWCYEDGVLLNSIYDLYKSTNDKKYYDFVYNYYDSMISDDGVIQNYDPLKYSIDDVCPGICLVKLYRDTKKDKFKKALDLMYGQMMKHPRTKEGSFWHKQIYPNQVWMDGIYMGVLFISLYAKEFNIKETIDDVDKQLHNLLNRLYDPDRKLFVHAYDEARVMKWADPVTGKSPNVWARAFGWVMMAVVDIYEELKLDICKEILTKGVEGVKPYMEEGMLYQIIDVRRKHNYLETSGSSMLAYALFKGKRLGMICEDELRDRLYNTILTEKFDGYNLYDICLVGGLDNTRRNGSFEYYMSESICANEAKGVAPFILTYSESLRNE